MTISIHAPSRERPYLRNTAQAYAYISIHAPSRERPYFFYILPDKRQISIHAPSRERRRVRQSTTNDRYFNPRSLAGATNDYKHLKPPGSISIHAPSRERRIISKKSTQDSLFQSTLPRGSDSLSLALSLSTKDFNPRSLAGATQSPSVYI